MTGRWQPAFFASSLDRLPALSIRQNRELRDSGRRALQEGTRDGVLLDRWAAGPMDHWTAGLLDFWTS